MYNLKQVRSYKCFPPLQYMHTCTDLGNRYMATYTEKTYVLLQICRHKTNSDGESLAHFQCLEISAQDLWVYLLSEICKEFLFMFRWDWETGNLT